MTYLVSLKRAQELNSLRVFLRGEHLNASERDEVACERCGTAIQLTDRIMVSPGGIVKHPTGLCHWQQQGG